MCIEELGRVLNLCRRISAYHNSVLLSFVMLWLRSSVRSDYCRHSTVTYSLPSTSTCPSLSYESCVVYVGFSYKKGSKEIGRFVKNFMYLPVLSCSTNSSCLDSSFVKHVSLSNSIFYSVAARVVGLNTAMLKPSKV